MEEAVMKMKSKSEESILTTCVQRREKLKSLSSLLRDNEKEITDSVLKDFKKPKMELSVEMDMVLGAISNAFNNLQDWMSKNHVTKTFAFYTDTCYYTYEPYGIVYIISTWNYPIIMSLQPLVSSLSAGNFSIISIPKAMENYFNTISRLFHLYHLDDIANFILTDFEQLIPSLEHKVDFIFFTGSLQTGQKVMKMAAEHLTPLALELGGKSPCFVDDECDLERASKNISFARFSNSGQTCIAVDYVLCSRKTANLLLELIKKDLVNFYGNNPMNSESYGRIINSFHTKRLLRLIEETKGVKFLGGNVSVTECYVEPTVISDVTFDDKLMESEIFGPILPILIVESKEEALSIIRKLPEPLVLNLFTKLKCTVDFFTKHTKSGNVLVNETLKSMAVHELPFGGIGQSGFGRYHGFSGFECFTYKRSHFESGYFGSVRDNLCFPPYKERNGKINRLLLVGDLKESCNGRRILSMLAITIPALCISIIWKIFIAERSVI